MYVFLFCKRSFLRDGYFAEFLDLDFKQVLDDLANLLIPFVRKISLSTLNGSYLKQPEHL